MRRFYKACHWFSMILLSFILIGPYALYAQCSFTNLNPTYCTNDASFALTGSTNYFGPGVSGTTFNPGVAGVGVHTLFATSGSASSYTVNASGTFNRLIVAGTVVNPPDDGQVAGIAIPFTFNFFGTDYTLLNIGRNGVIGFGPSSVTGITNQAFPNVAVPNN